METELNQKLFRVEIFEHRTGKVRGILGRGWPKKRAEERQKAGLTCYNSSEYGIRIVEEEEQKEEQETNWCHCEQNMKAEHLDVCEDAIDVYTGLCVSCVNNQCKSCKDEGCEECALEELEEQEGGSQ